MIREAWSWCQARWHGTNPPLIKQIRIWWHARWFMKHWQVGKPFARYCATRRVEFLDKGKS